MGDPGSLEQVLMNLAANARDAMPEGGTLLIETSEVEQGRYVRIRVNDTGIGMSDSIKRRIFDPFFTTKPMGEGTGLGLSISHGIVARHGGQMQVESRPGEGARFTIRLPLEPPPALEGRT